MSFFFTELDDSLRPRGSRDPVGLELVWSAVGRKLVGNLTTVTANLDNFAIALVGFHLCGAQGREPPQWELFERFEQATGHARATPGVLGYRRINAAKRNGTVLLGSSPNARILDDQRRAGIWGLYTSALVVTGLATPERMLTSEGQRIVSLFLAAVPRSTAMSPVLDRRCKELKSEQLEAVRMWIRTVLQCGTGRNALSAALLSGGQRGSVWQQELQRQCADFLRQDETRDGAGIVRRLLRHLELHSELLGSYATRTLALDEILVLVNVVFSWLLGCHGLNEAKVAEKLAILKSWPEGRLQVPFFSEIDDAEWRRRTGFLQKFCDAIRDEKWKEATWILLDYHRSIMEPRGGSPWCFLENGKVKVVTSASQGVLPSKSELAAHCFECWIEGKSTGFFLTSFIAVMQQTSAVEVEQ